MLFIRQTWTLTYKNILIVLFRHPFSTPVRCFLLPVIFSWFLAYARNLFIPPSHYGIGNATPVRSLADALGTAAGGGRNTIALVNNGFTGGDINTVINQVADQVKAEGVTVKILSQQEDLLTICRSSIRGVSSCYGAAVFYGSPTEGPGGIWNYSLRADGGLGDKIDITNANNDQEVYALPLQHAIDFAIATQNTTIDQSALPSRVDEYPYTTQTQKERSDQIRVRYMGGIIDILAVAFFIGIVGVIYQLVGLMASERELGMSQIIEASMPNKRRWEPQAVRLLANHIAFDLMFLPGWIAIGLILKYGVFAKTSAATLVFFNILTGLSLSSFSIFGAAFFHKAQLSGIVTTIVSLLLAVLAQVIAKSSTGAVAVLSLLFPPMNYTFFTVLMARWERQNEGTNLVIAAPQNPSTLPGIAFFIFSIIQILVFPILGAIVERALYGTASKGRQLSSGTEVSKAAVQLSDFTKCYRPSWWARNIATRFGKRKETVVAVDALNLTIPQGQIMVLLGANGSGKSTTLEAIAGLNTVTSGTVAVDGFGGLGICPQRNVLWDNLTAFEHVRIFNRLKSTDKPSTKIEIHELIKACDLDRKVDAQSRTLSGGQKRKLQLSMMFTGGSRVCCVDECSSGVDALARQKLWNILLNERGKRTIIFTTHFLDEADLLSDQIAILSRGSLKAQGSAVELKHRLGGGFRIHVFKTPGDDRVSPHFDGVSTKAMVDQTMYTLPDSGRAADFVRLLETHGIKNYEISSPTIEDIFFNVAENMEAMSGAQSTIPDSSSSEPNGKSSAEVIVAEDKDLGLEGSDSGMKLQTGKRIGLMRQALTLFRKRWTVFQRNYIPYAAAFLIPFIAAGLVTLFLKNFTALGCSPTQSVSPSNLESLLTQVDYDIVVGPASKISPQALAQLEATLPGGNSSGSGGSGLSDLMSSIHPINGTLEDFNNYIGQFYGNVTPGGFFLGDDSSPPTFAYVGNGDISLATITQNMMDNLLLNISISSQYQAFDTPWVPSAGKTLQLIVYFGLAMSAYPAFFALYPTLERLRNVRQLHYSNGVRSVCLWSAYLTFDFMIVIATSVLTIIIFRGASNVWYHAEYLFVVLFLYGIASTLLSYVISLFARSQLAAFAFAAGGQAVMFLLYFIAYLSVLTYSPTNKVDSYLLVTHFTIGLITPAGNLIRALFVALNVFSVLCEGNQIASYPGKITLYGGPILYLIGQSFFLFGVLLWWDSGSIWARLRRKQYKTEDTEEVDPLDDEIAAEVKRVSAAPDDGLRIQHITKAYGRNVAVQDITFGVKRGEVFALLGPNGAGKSTTISLIRGDILPSHTSGEIYVEDIPISKRRADARHHLGVCPQVDACDQMTVLEHLRFYARVRGVDNVEHNVREVIRAVGLGPFQHRMAFALSGGNKRKLSLAIALMGNPSVLLLDEPSSGMDVCAKRVMWKTLASVVPGRSLVLTTHSMEEADALADRAGIMGKKMLALGTSEGLRRKHGDRYHVHLIMKTAPHTSDEGMIIVKQWIAANLEGAVVEDKTFHGQLRFSVPASRSIIEEAKSAGSSTDIIRSTNDRDANRSGIGALFTMLEVHKEELGFEYYSVSQTTLDQVFLSIVGKHNIEEENYGQGPQKKGFWSSLRRP
ncbi:MAG: hypothetical protein ALECFALPRED_001670 [Alectoria fallacina]|uniref:ABC transporter domain-containing protein n=1 Tax=Alectoria fallacina TaxID=1903189 RepID=A0A8H3IMR5_9LECA|nr:MAG: hypothetical protein ALECFALPRED_001670 [Alectoria fallacina]